jgi:hypothetical protein
MIAVDCTLDDCYSSQFFDVLSSYAQANNIDISTDKKFYLIDHITEDYPRGYDYYLVENAAEPMHVLGPAKHFVDEQKADLLIGSYLHKKHFLFNRTISFPSETINCNMWYTHPFYFTSLLFKKQHRDKNLTFINGEKRSVRHYFLDQVCDYMDLVIDNNLSTVKTKLSRYHTDADRTFVNYCNNLYDIDNSPTKHISFDTINFGGDYGITRLSYFPLPEYFTSRCMVYPETTFCNWEIYPTEKTWKCVKAKTHWIMFSGSGSYEIMREVGFRSIVELCPDNINNFDMIEDHVLRIEKISKCCEYISNNSDIFDSLESHDILESNYENFHNPILSIERSIKPFIDKYLGEQNGL